jgi:hypothetical protein
MSNAEIITLIDTILALPISDSTKDELNALRSQVKTRTIAGDERNYIINLCKRLRQGEDESKKPSPLCGADEDRGRENAEARRKRVECRHQVGYFFDSTDDMKWLYFDLAIKGAFEGARNTDRELEEFVRSAIWATLSGYQPNPLSTLIEETAHYIEKPRFHCTALRDFLILKLMGSLPQLVGDDPIPPKKNWKARLLLCIGVLMTVPFIWIYANWWTAVLVLAFLWFLARRWETQYENNANNRWSLRHYSKHFTQEVIRKLIERVRQGGFDEPTLIEQIELFDVSKTLPGSAVPLRSDGTSVQAPFVRPTLIPIVIPGVLYALLRLPRRNIQNELSVKFSALDEQKRKELMRRWRKFVDPMLTYDEPRNPTKYK